jgi:hypothetical protein
MTVWSHSLPRRRAHHSCRGHRIRPAGPEGSSLDRPDPLPAPVAVVPELLRLLSRSRLGAIARPRILGAAVVGVPDLPAARLLAGARRRGFAARGDAEPRRRLLPGGASDRGDGLPALDHVHVVHRDDDQQRHRARRARRDPGHRRVRRRLAACARSGRSVRC